MASALPPQATLVHVADHGRGRALFNAALRGGSRSPCQRRRGGVVLPSRLVPSRTAERGSCQQPSQGDRPALGDDVRWISFDPA